MTTRNSRHDAFFIINFTKPNRHFSQAFKKYIQVYQVHCIYNMLILCIKGAYTRVDLKISFHDLIFIMLYWVVLIVRKTSNASFRVI